MGYIAVFFGIILVVLGVYMYEDSPKSLQDATGAVFTVIAGAGAVLVGSVGVFVEVFSN